MAALVAGVPLLGLWEMGWLRRRLAAGVPHARVAAYRLDVATLTLLGGAGLWLWLRAGRSWDALGFGVPDRWQEWLVLGVLLGVVYSSVRQVRTLRESPDALKRAAARMRSLETYLPHTEPEGRWFRAVGISAGVFEEILYRGFLIVYLTAFMPVWIAAVAAGVAFGFAHVYQGVAGVLRTGITGLVFALLFAWTGQLWGLVALHVAVDVLNGGLAREVLGAEATA